MSDAKRIGVVGARGHVGVELLSLLLAHPSYEVAYVGSRALAGTALRDLVDTDSALAFESLDATRVAERSVDAVVLALPNGVSGDYVQAIEAAQPDAVVLDLSADHRFDDDWTYGLPELNRDAILGASRIANPGCYATAAQLALWPLLDELDGPAAIFGVSGYSGAGTTPSDNNNVEHLRDNLIPYKLTDHIHEREIGHRLGRSVHFMPHVAPFFRGITLTINCALKRDVAVEEVRRRFAEHYDAEPLVTLQDQAPLVRDAVGKHHATIGGFTTQAGRVVVIATLDNLLKGAATQALQNLNLALSLPERSGLR